MQLEDIKKLAELARIDMTDEELMSLAKDFDPILEYVGHVKEAVDNTESDVKFSFINVAREDVVTNTGGKFTDAIVAQFPEKEGDYLKVKQIL